MSKIKKIIKRKIEEDAPTVNMGSGNIAGLGVGPHGEPGVSKKNQRKHTKILRRTAPNLRTGIFAGEQTFIVPTHVFERAKWSKKKGQHWKTFIQEDDISPFIREFAYNNKNSPIIFEDEKTGYMCYARYGKGKKK